MDYKLNICAKYSLYPKAQKAAAKNILRKFLAEMPEGTIAYIAGGAPRDWHHGWGCRDIDIFFRVPADHNNDLAATLHLHKHYDRIHHKYHSYEYDGQGVMSVHEVPATKFSNAKSVQYTNVQLIRVQDHPLKVIKDFPISLSRIWMNPEGEVECDLWYRSGYNHYTIYEVNTKQYNYRYLEKILPRFSAYTFIPKYWTGPRPAEEQIKEIKC